MPAELDLGSPQSRASTALRIINYAAEREYSGAAKDELLSRLAATLGEDFEELRARRSLNLMNSAEILEVSRSGISIEMHSRSHCIPNDRLRFEQDLRRNADQIKEWTGVAPSRFCYPSGLVAPNWVEWLREFPVKAAVTCTPAFASAGDDAMLLPRYVDGSHSSALEFESWISGFTPIVGRKVAMHLTRETAVPAPFKASAAISPPLSQSVSTRPSDRAPDWPRRSKGRI